MDLVTREARLFKYGSGTGSNFSKIRGLRESLSGGGVSSGLLSFLKIADRSAERDQVGRHDEAGGQDGHPRRRPSRHRVLYELEGRGGVQGRLPRRGLGPPPREGGGPGRGRPRRRQAWPRRTASRCERNPALRREAKSALRAGVPAPFLHQLLSMFRQGDYSAVEGAREPCPSTTPHGRARPTTTVSGQSSNNSVRLDNDFMRAVQDDGDWELMARTTGKVMKRMKARELWDDDSARRLEVRRPRPPVPRHRQRVAYLPRRRGDTRLQPLLRVHVPRRHRLQPRLASTSSPSTTRRPGASTTRPTATRCGSGRPSSRYRS